MSRRFAPSTVRWCASVYASPVARSFVRVRIVLCPTKCMVAAYLFRSSNTGASDSREGSSCDGVGSFAFMYTTKCVSGVKSAICPFASRRSAQCAYASTSSRIARPSAASLEEMAMCLLIRWSPYYPRSGTPTKLPCSVHLSPDQRFRVRDCEQPAVQSELGQVAAELDPDRLVNATNLDRVEAGGRNQPCNCLTRAGIVGGVEQHGSLRGSSCSTGERSSRQCPERLHISRARRQQARYDLSGCLVSGERP